MKEDPLVVQLTLGRGLFIIFQMDKKRAHRPITEYALPFLQLSLRIENIASREKLQRLSW